MVRPRKSRLVPAMCFTATTDSVVVLFRTVSLSAVLSQQGVFPLTSGSSFAGKLAVVVLLY